MKKIILVLLLTIPLITALQITEIELNPMGKDKGHEWIEFYSEQEVNLGDYKIINNDGVELILNETFQGYYIHTFKNQWLDNTDEKLFLYENNNLIQETSLLEDNQNNELTFSYCNSWKLTNPTKNKRNDCEEEVQDNQDEQETPQETQQQETLQKTKSEQKVILPKINDPINLNPKTIKTKENNKIQDMSKYSIIVFCILLVTLILTKKKKKKTEFK